jgi:hypothetical protein
VFSDPKVQKLLPQRQSSTLESLFSFLSKSAEMLKVSVGLGSPDSKYSTGEHYHEGGYDAYITGTSSSMMAIGYCFAKMLHYLTKEELERYTNQFFAFRAPYNFDLGKNEELHDNVSSSDESLDDHRNREAAGVQASRRRSRKTRRVQGTVLRQVHR